MLVVLDDPRGSRHYHVRVDFDERGWAGHVRLAGDRDVAVRARDLQDLDEALAATLADLEGADPDTVAVHPTRVGSPPRPARPEALDGRAADRILVALVDAATSP